MRALLIASFLLLSGCATLIPTPGEVPKRLTLESLKPKSMTKPSGKQLMVDMPNVYPPFDNQRLALRPEPQVLDYYANVEWGDRLSVLVQESLVNSLQDAALFAGITRTNNGIIPDYVLKVDVRTFNVEKTPDLKVRGEYHLQLINAATRQVIAQKTIHSELPLANETISSVGQGLNEVHLQLSEQLISWLKEYL